MRQYYILSPDESNSLTLEGETLADAIKNGKETNPYVVFFMDEYNIEECYVEEGSEY